MKLILSRHGNTFGPDDPVTWVGKNNDLPLVAAGIAQAQGLAQYLREKSLIPTAIFCSPLRRTYDYANIVINSLQLSLSPIIDVALTELDYGTWSGKTTEQIIAEFGSDELHGWQKFSHWPVSAGWKGTEAEIKKSIRDFANSLVNHDTADAMILVISSNGVLRYFLDLMPGEFKRRIAQQQFMIKTGNIAEMRHDNNVWHLDAWNKNPTEKA